MKTSETHMKSLIQKFVQPPGPPGYERQVRKLAQSEIESLVDEIHVDELGNLLARRGMQAADGLKVMLTAHLDEIGLIVAHVERHGLVRFLPLGPVRPVYCPGTRVRFLDGTPGIIGVDPWSDSGKTPDFAHMFIDVGVASQDDCPVRSGDVAVFERSFQDMGGRLISNALNNRVGLAIIAEVLRQMEEQGIQSPHQMLIALCAQGEVGARGVSAAAYSCDPYLGLVIDVMESEDNPVLTGSSARIGEGPAIIVRDLQMITDPRLVSWMVDTAEKEGLPYQLAIIANHSGAAQTILSVRAGVLVGSLAIPCRYINSPLEMVDYKDVQNAVRLLIALLRNPVKFE
jgi:putative aminopeptidase FrvX